MKKILCLCLCICVILTGALIPASAASPEAELICYYYQDETLTAFLTANDAEAMMNSDFYLKNGEAVNPTKGTGAAVSEIDLPVSYLILIDVSDSMLEYSESVRSFVQGLIENEQKDFTVTIAAVGESFRVIRKDLTEKSTILSIIDSISYTDEVSELCDGVLGGIEYLTATPPSGGEIQSIILLTDGDTYMRDGARSDAAIRKIAGITKQYINESPEYLIHTVCTGEWNTLTYNALSVSKGLDLQIPYYSDGYSYGKSVSNFIDSLYKVDIPHTTNEYYDRFDAEMVIASREDGASELLSLNGVWNIDVKQPRFVPHFDDEGNIISVDVVGDDPTETAATENPSTSSASIENPSNADATDATLAPATDDLDDGEVTKILGLPWWLFAVIVGGVLLLIVMIIVIAVSASRRKKRNAVPRRNDGDAYQPQNGRTPEAQAITVIPEVLYGSAHCAASELKLYDQLIIGTSPDCDIVIDDTIAAPHNTRVFIENGMIYIEDLNEASCTYLGGMKIFSKNRLRSGEEIMVGDTSFKLRF